MKSGYPLERKRDVESLLSRLKFFKSSDIVRSKPTWELLATNPSEPEQQVSVGWFGRIWFHRLNVIRFISLPYWTSVKIPALVAYFRIKRARGNWLWGKKCFPLNKKYLSQFAPGPGNVEASWQNNFACGWRESRGHVGQWMTSQWTHSEAGVESVRGGDVQLDCFDNGRKQALKPSGRCAAMWCLDWKLADSELLWRKQRQTSEVRKTYVGRNTYSKRKEINKRACGGSHPVYSMHLVRCGWAALVSIVGS